MKTHLPIAAMATAFLLVLMPARGQAADCAQVANTLAAQSQAEMLSFSERTVAGVVKCEVKLLLPGKNGAPPRVVTKVQNG
jgi:hypothetical protein